MALSIDRELTRIQQQFASARFAFGGLPSAQDAAQAIAAEQIDDEYVSMLRLRQLAPTWDDGIRTERTRRLAAMDAAKLASPRTLATLASL